MLLLLFINGRLCSRAFGAAERSGWNGFLYEFLFFFFFSKDWRSWSVLIFCWNVWIARLLIELPRRSWHILLMLLRMLRMLCRLLSFGPLLLLLLLLLTFVSKLHNRDVNLLKDNTVAILFKIFGGMNDHINFFH